MCLTIHLYVAGTTLWRVTSSILRSSNLTKSILTSSSITMGSSSIFRRSILTSWSITDSIVGKMVFLDACVLFMMVSVWMLSLSVVYDDVSVWMLLEQELPFSFFSSCCFNLKLSMKIVLVIIFVFSSCCLSWWSVHWCVHLSFYKQSRSKT